MLVIQRLPGEDTIITVPPSDKVTTIRHSTVRVDGQKVKHGWEAPEEVLVHRREVHEAILRDGFKPPKPKQPTPDSYVPRSSRRR